MPTVTSENKAEFDRDFLQKKSGSTPENNSADSISEEAERASKKAESHKQSEYRTDFHHLQDLGNLHGRASYAHFFAGMINEDKSDYHKEKSEHHKEQQEKFYKASQKQWRKDYKAGETRRKQLHAEKVRQKMSRDGD